MLSCTGIRLSLRTREPYAAKGYGSPSFAVQRVSDPGEIAQINVPPISI